MKDFSPKIFEAATEVTTELLLFKQPSDAILSSFFRKNKWLGKRERPLVADLAYEVIRNKLYLEKSTSSSDPGILCLAALTKLLGISSSVLKNIVPFKYRANLAELTQQAAPRLACHERYSLPAWLWQKIEMKYGVKETSDIARSLLQKAPFDLRVNTMICDRDAALERFKKDEICAQKTSLSSTGLRISTNFGIQKHDLFQNGSIEIQDQGSQLLAELTDVKRGQMVVDFCAGAGGKTLALGALMRNSGRLYAFDVSQKRIERFKPRLKRSGLSNVYPQTIGSENDPRIKRLYGKIDRVLVDAPCTGTGTLRRNPDIKWRQDEEGIHALAHKQYEILVAASRLAKKHGRVIYATCSLLHDENEAVTEKFIENNNNFRLLNFSEVTSVEKPFKNTGPYFRVLPHTDDCDGFFAAIFERT